MSYSYDVWGNLTSSSENIPNANGWSNPYRYDGRDGARYDTETSLYWLSTRAYDPTLGRFLQRDPLGRFPLFFWSQPYVYAGNNPLINVDPSGQRFADEDILSQETAQQQIAQTRRTQQTMARMPRVTPRQGTAPHTSSPRTPQDYIAQDTCDKVCQARKIAGGFAERMLEIVTLLGGGGVAVDKVPLLAKLKALLGGWLSKIPFLGGALAAGEDAIGEIVAAVAAEAFMLWVFFTWQANWEPDSWLTSKVAFGASIYAVTTILISGSVLIGAGVVALTDAVGGGPEDPVGDILAAIFGIIGLGGSAVGFGLGAMGTLESERRVLWGL